MHIISKLRYLFNIHMSRDLTDLPALATTTTSIILKMNSTAQLCNQFVGLKKKLVINKFSVTRFV